MRRSPDPLAGFGYVEQPPLTWREAGQQVAIGLAFCAAVFVFLGPALLALTRML